MLAEMNLERSADSEREAAYFCRGGNAAVRGREGHVSGGDIAAVNHHAAGVAGKRQR